MKGFFKTILMGLIYIVTLPLVILLLALYAVYLLGVFIFMGVKSIIIFFKGGTPLGDLPEDVEAKRILMQKEEQAQAMAAAATAMYQQQQAYYQQQNMGMNRPMFDPTTQQQMPNQYPQQQEYNQYPQQAEQPQQPQNVEQEQSSNEANFNMENYFDGDNDFDNGQGGNDNGTY